MTSGSATLGMPSRLSELPRWLEGAQGFSALIAALNANQAATIDGAWNSSASLTAAALAQNASTTILIVLAHPRDLDAWHEDLFTFIGLRATVVPSWATLPTADNDLEESGGKRLRVLRQLESDQPPKILLTTIQALLQPVPDRAQLATHRRRLRVSQDILLEEIVAWLVDQNFQRMEA